MSSVSSRDWQRSALLSVGVGLAVWIWHPAAARLAPASTCAGLLDLAAVGLARLAPDRPLGPLLQQIDLALFAVAMAAFAYVGRIVVGRAWPVVIAAVALSVTPAFDASLALPRSASLLAAVCAFGAVTALTDAPARVRSLAAAATLAVCAAIAPALTVPLGILAVAAGAATSGPSVGRRAATAATALCVVVAAAWGTLLLVPGLDGPARVAASTCVSGRAAEGSLATLVRFALTATGAYVLVLAALGAFALRMARRTHVLIAGAGLAAAPLLAVSIAPADVALVVPLLVVPLWIGAAMGLREIASVARHGFGGRLAAVLLALLVPWLAWSSRATPMAGELLPFGHDTLTLASVEALRARLPPHGIVVREDAIVDLLLRAARTTMRPEVVQADRAAVDLAAGRASVFALPLAQRHLQNEAFALQSMPGPGLTGVARVERRGTCRGVTTAWTNVTDVPRDRSLAIFARADSEAGPVVIYLATSAPSSPRPVAWPDVALSGFHADVYSSAPESRTQLQQIAAEDGLPSDWSGMSSSSITRLEMWRTPEAPRTLQVSIGVETEAAIAQLVRVAPQSRLLLCTASPYDIVPLQIVSSR